MLGRKNRSVSLISLVLCIMMVAALLPSLASAELAAPKLSGASASGNGIKVTWNEVSGATAYRVYRKGDGSGWKAIKDVTGNSYTDTTAKAGVTYTYTVRCIADGSIASDYDRSGVSASWSGSSSGNLATPTLVSAKGDNGNSGIRVTWKKVSGATGYRIYRKKSGESWKGIRDVGDVDSYLDTGASADTTYVYTVRCLKDGTLSSGYDRNGVSGSWKKSTANLATPALSNAVADGSGIKVTWNGVSGAAGYRVYRKGDGSSWKAIKDVTGTSYTDTTAKAGVTYTYTVRCLADGKVVSGYDKVGVSAAWTSATAGYVGTPALVSAKGETSNSGIRVTWKKVSGASGYRIYRKTSGASWKAIKDVGNVDNYLDTAANAGTTYIYTVRCLKDGVLASNYDKNGVSGSWAKASGLGTPKLTGAAPEGSGIRVNWNAVSGAAAYRVYRKTSGSSWQHLVDVKTNTYLDNTASSGASYSYTVRCLDNTGKVVSAYESQGVTAYWSSGNTGSYSTPSLVKAEYSGNAVVFTWNAVSGAPGYRVFRKTGTGSWVGIGNSTTTSYTDTQVSSGTTYTYTVRVTDASGKMASGYDTTGKKIVFYGVPALKSASAVNTGIEVVWNAVSGAQRYLVYRKSGSGNWTRIGTTTGTSYTDTGVAASTTYTYTVRVASSDGKTLLGDYDRTGVSATYVGKTAVSALSLETNGVQVEWNTILGASSYRLFRKFGTGDWTAVTTTTGNSYKDTNVVNNITYTYIVRALDSAGNFLGTYDSNGRSVTYYAAPHLLECVRSDGGLTTTWEAVEGISNYTVFRKTGNGSWMRMGQTSSTSYTDTSVPSGTLCRYTVRCTSADGTAHLSSFDSVGVGLTSYMETPILISAEAEWGYIYIDWQEVDKATNYKVYRKTGDREAWVPIGTTSWAGYSDSNIQNGGTYYYTVATCDGSGNDMSLYNITGLSVTYYSCPVLASVENVASGIKFKWNAVDGVSTYRVYRKTGNSAWTAYASVTGTEYIDTSVVTKGHYWYSVSCLVNGSEVSTYDYSGISSTFYSAPVMATIKNQNGSIKVTWNDVDGIDTYRLYRKINNGQWQSVTDVNSTEYVDSNVSSGTTYTYTVRCILGSDMVSDYNSTIAAKYLSVPTVSSVTTTETGKAKVSWNKVTGATDYNLYRKQAAGNWSLVKAVGNVSEYTDSGLASGTTYQYMVVAKDGSSISADGTGVNVTIK